ncbi:hypothetical protein PR202_ga10585 [Eleusine coracana subsp. coracana]|uniref:Uncharacterized protein n=1 Tax=Eleusine coracana subsp. coracana TaxID=191504 RepID=A0AAV5C733_ELECO|nr:hypothetical protein PR202_ga10585 [Eleusine coracana subsp. coracana]
MRRLRRAVAKVMTAGDPGGSAAMPSWFAKEEGEASLCLRTQGKPHETEDVMTEISSGGGIDGNRDFGGVVEAGSDTGDVHVRKLEMRVRMLEAEIQKMKKEHFLLQPRKKISVKIISVVIDKHDISEISIILPSAFRRRFRELHPAPLLGLFFETPSVILDPTLPAFPSFVPVRRRDRDLTAAVRHGDFFLTSLQGYPDMAQSWDILDCRGGYALVMNGDQATLAVVNSLARRSEWFFDLRHGDILEDSHGFTVRHNPRLI